MKTKEELQNRLSDLKAGLRLIDSGDISAYGNQKTKIKLIREIAFIEDVLK